MLETVKMSSWGIAAALVTLLLFAGSCAPFPGNDRNGGNENGEPPPPPCKDGLEECDEICADTQRSLYHCGACGVRCFAGQGCVDGHCIGTSALSPQELHDALQTKDFLLVNVREPPVGIIPGTDASCCNEMPDQLAELIGPDPRARVVVYCRTNPRSLDAIEQLRSKGYTSISYLRDGVKGWLEAGFDVE